MNLLAAEITKPPRSVTTKYGDRVVIDCIAQNKEVTIWRRGSDQYALSLKPGQQVTVSEDSKGKYNLVDNVEPYPPENPRKPADIGQNRSDEIRDYTERLAKLYAHCYKQAVNQMGGLITDEEGLRAIATSIFIATTKHFNL